MVHSLVWLDCKTEGKERTGSEFGKVGTLWIVKGLKYRVELEFQYTGNDYGNFFKDVDKLLRCFLHYFSLKSLQQLSSKSVLLIISLSVYLSYYYFSYILKEIQLTHCSKNLCRIKFKLLNVAEKALHSLSPFFISSLIFTGFFPPQI